MKDPHNIILRPHITEKTVALSYGDPRITEEKELVRKYTFVVAKDANKIEIKSALETIYNEGKKAKEQITVERVTTTKGYGKTKRVGQTRKAGKTPDFKKATVTLAKGQVLEDYGV